MTTNKQNEIKNADDIDLIEQRIDGQLAYKGSFFNVLKDRVLLPNGHEASREYILHPGAVAVIACFEDGDILMERQFRYPVGKVMLEIPAGKIDPNEDPLACAKRELSEETGYSATHWQYLTTIHNAIGYSNEHLDIYLAKGLKAGQKHTDDEEFIHVVKMSPKMLIESVKKGEITDVKTIIGLFWLEKIMTHQWS